MGQAVHLFADYFSSVYENHSDSFDIDITDEINDFSISTDTITKVITDINVCKTNSPDKENSWYNHIWACTA